MNRFKILLVAAIVAIASALPASAQFKFGLKAGMAVNSLHFNESTFDSDNRTGFTGGLMVEFTAPVIGLGFDLSAMYVRRTAQWVEANKEIASGRDYFTIPLNLKWKFKLPLIKPFLTTGPEVSFLTSRKAVSEAWRNKSVDYSWNFGAGVEILGHLQLAAQYGMGLNKALEKVGLADNARSIDAKDRFWTITAAYLF